MSAKLPASLARNPRLSAWLRFRADGVVEVRSGKVELGQGILTALAQIAAEELDVALERIAMMPAATGTSPDEGVTSGSLSTQDSGMAVRHACAEARALCLAEASRRLGVAVDSLAVADGEIRGAGGARTSYWAIGDAAIAGRDATASVPPKGSAHSRYVGRAIARIDLADKVLGHARYIHDLALPGMLHGRVLRPPSPAATLEKLEEDRARAMPGVVAVVRDGSFVGVLAESERQAQAAVERLRRDARWNEPATLPDEARLGAWLHAARRETALVAERDSGSSPGARRTVRASYTKPFIAHASIGPSCAVAHWNGTRLRVWSHTQGIYNLRADLSIAFAVPAEDIVVEHVQGAGCYGHNGADDVAYDAALLARAADGRPVRVQWSREDELSWSPFGPAMAIDLEAELDDHGEVVAWRGAHWSNGHTMRPGRAKIPTLLAASQLADPFERPVSVNPPFAGGGGAERNSVPAYDFPRLRVECHRVLEMPLRASALRSLGAFANVFAIESFVDDIARMRHEDPVAWRLRHLSDPRARAVIEAVARRSSWGAPLAGEGRGRGIGWARYKGFGAYCAVVAEVELTHEVRVTRLVIAADVGLAVNPDGVANQIEGGAIQATSWALKEAVRFDRTRVTSGAWESYPILRFSEVPRTDVEVIQREHEPSVGAGEAAQGPTAAAIANAVREAIGARIRDLPITAERIAAATLAEEAEPA
ncbi:MAG TPA: molybdopterin cofactor-binding domain-containing protein [Usitatibacter sp.]|nr:molybdopterin cofactor-binding domain-containing protein [Usitatibacter sp.]